MGSTKRIGYSHNVNLQSNFFKALGHPARLAIVEKIIEEGSVTCSQLNRSLPLSIPTISMHLKVLYDCGMVGRHVIANETYYLLHQSNLITFNEYLDFLRSQSEGLNYNYQNVYFSGVY